MASSPEGLRILAKVKAEFGVPIVTDIHEIDQAEAIAAVADIVQIPAFLCRQTDLVIATAKATLAAGGLLHVKKGQFLAPWDCKNILDKIREATGRDFTILCERGATFGYNNLVVDMLGIEEMKQPRGLVTIDATHAVQAAGRRPFPSNSASTGGRRFMPPLLAKAAIAAEAPTGCSWNSIPTRTRRCATARAVFAGTALATCRRRRRDRRRRLLTSTSTQATTRRTPSSSMDLSSAPTSFRASRLRPARCPVNEALWLTGFVYGGVSRL